MAPSGSVWIASGNRRTDSLTSTPFTVVARCGPGHPLVIRNRPLDANDFFANRQGRGKVPFRQNQYGFQVGGPVYLPKLYNGRESTFFFFNWEAIPQRSPDNINVTVPTAADGGFRFAFVMGGETAIGGRVPVNPSGGLESKGHPVGATGLMQAVTVFWQLQQTIPKHFGNDTLQIKGARRGLIHSHAGTGTYVTVSIMERQ